MSKGFDNSNVEKNAETNSTRSGRRRKGRKSGSKSSNGISRDIHPHITVESGMGNGSNDKQWYRNIPYLTDDAASIPFNVPSGIPQVVGRSISKGTAGDAGYYAASCYMPGVITFDIAPVLGGRVDGPSDAPNVAAQQIYTATRKANSGAANYDKTDEMLTILGVGSAYMLYEHLVRAYKTATTFNYLNRYQPNVLVEAMGLSPSLIVDNLADFRALLDLFAYKLSSICIPASFDLLKRQGWLFSNIYKDSENPRANLLLFVPKILYVWNEGEAGEERGSTYLMPVDIKHSLGDCTTIDQLRQVIDIFLNPLLGSQDVGVISGDIAKAFPNDLFKIVIADEHSGIEPVFNREVLSEIENMTIFQIDQFVRGSVNIPGQNVVNLANWSIKQNNDNLALGPYLEQFLDVTWGQSLFGGQCATFNPVINMHWDHPTSDDVMVATRFTALNSPSTTSAGEIDICGTEICVGAQVVTYGNFNLPTGTLIPDQDDMAATTKVKFSSMLQTTRTSVGGTSTNVQALSLVNAFDWHPLIYYYAGSKASSSDERDEVALISVIGDLDNWKVISPETLLQIHNAAIMSLYAVK